MAYKIEVKQVGYAKHSEWKAVHEWLEEDCGHLTLADFWTLAKRMEKYGYQISMKEKESIRV